MLAFSENAACVKLFPCIFIFHVLDIHLAALINKYLLLGIVPKSIHCALGRVVCHACSFSVPTVSPCGGVCGGEASGQFL